MSNAARATSEVEVLDPIVASPAHDAVRRRRAQQYEHNWHWQDSWAARLPWAESVLGCDCRASQVRCIVCTEVKGCQKLLVPKIDSLYRTLEGGQCIWTSEAGRILLPATGAPHQGGRWQIVSHGC
jgi:hypothetical protein